MKFLLVNENIAVKKLFNISAKKANIELDVIPSFSQLRLQEDYSCIFVDDGVSDIDMVQNLKNKMITTKFCLIISKNRPLEGVFGIFDTYIKKPFLPTDIYDVFKKEKYSEMKFGIDSYEDMPSINVKVNSDNEDITTINYDGISAADVSDINMGDNNIDSFLQEDSKIDLGEFNDNDDEFISGIKDDKKEENNQYQSEYNFDDISLKPMSNIHELALEEVSKPEEPTPNLSMDDLPTTQDLPSTQRENKELDISNPSFESNNLEIEDDLYSAPISDSPLDSDEGFESDINPSFESMSFTMRKKADDDIDFASVFAMQDEFLQAQNNEKKPVIGGDIFSKKEEEEGGSTYEDPLSSMMPAYEENYDDSIMDSNVDSSLDSNLNISNPVDNLDSKKEAISINDLSEIELENLDDETLLRLQEEYNSKEPEEYVSKVFDETPKILNKNDIDELNNLLQDTNNINATNTKETKEVNFLPQKEKEEATQKPVGQIQASSNSDLGIDIIKAFPIDKLRELLSGAQITINITFPTIDK